MPGLLGGEKPRSISTLPGKRQANGKQEEAGGNGVKWGPGSRVARLDRREESRSTGPDHRGRSYDGLEQAGRRKSGSEQAWHRKS